jgi:hypothetical protein
MIEQEVKDGADHDVHHQGKSQELCFADATVIEKKVIALAGKAFVIKAQQRAGSHERDRQNFRKLYKNNDRASE